MPSRASLWCTVRDAVAPAKALEWCITPERSSRRAGPAPTASSGRAAAVAPEPVPASSASRYA